MAFNAQIGRAPHEGSKESKQNRASKNDGGRTDWFTRAKAAWEKSTTFVDTNYRRDWETAIRMFNSQHPKDSKYHSDLYKFRSRIFRPKTRAVIRKHEATAATAFFSNLDVVSVAPAQSKNPMSMASAQVAKELLQHRLTTPRAGIPWFITLMGALQDALKMGLVISMQTWKFRSRSGGDEEKEGTLPDGTPVKVTVPVEEVIEDRPDVEIIPLENCRFDPNAYWADVVGTSPYLIINFPMHVYELKRLMSLGDTAGKKWKNYTNAEIKRAMSSNPDTTRQERSTGRKDPSTENSGAELSDYDVVWCRLYFMDDVDEKVTFWTLGDVGMLTDPTPVSEEYWHGEIPVVIGFCVVETHNVAPPGLPILGEQLQREANDIVNTRIDNVKLVLNKRYYVRRNAQVDTDSLQRNAPGGVTMVQNVDSDIKESTWNDVTSSSYQEQDRLNVDYDELLGNFASSSVLTNRKLNETVGGMQIMAQGANALTEYALRTFVETWVEPVLTQLVLLEQYYESDETVLALAAEKAQLWVKYGMSEVTDWMLRESLIVTVNVGMGATDPQTKVQKFLMALNQWVTMAPQLPPDANPEEIKAELFGLAGYRDANRFFTGEQDQRVVMAQQQVQQITQQLQQVTMEKDLNAKFDAKSRALDKREMEIKLRDLALDIREAEMQGDLSTADRLSLEFAKLKGEYDLKKFDIMLEDMRNRDKIRGDLQVKKITALADIRREDAETRARIEAEEREAQREERSSAKTAKEMNTMLAAHSSAMDKIMQSIAASITKPKKARLLRKPDGTTEIETL